MSPITLINAGVMHCRFNAILKGIGNGEYARAQFLTNDTIRLIGDAWVNEMTPELTYYYYESLRLLSSDIDLRNYTKALARLRLLSNVWER